MIARLVSDVPSIACVINWKSTFVNNLDLSNFHLESGLSYFDLCLSVSCWSVLWVLQDVTALISTLCYNCCAKTNKESIHIFFRVHLSMSDWQYISRMKLFRSS